MSSAQKAQICHGPFWWSQRNGIHVALLSCDVGAGYSGQSAWMLRFSVIYEWSIVVLELKSFAFRVLCTTQALKGIQHSSCTWTPSVLMECQICWPQKVCALKRAMLTVSQYYRQDSEKKCLWLSQNNNHLIVTNRDHAYAHNVHSHVHTNRRNITPNLATNHCGCRKTKEGRASFSPHIIFHNS